VNELLPSALVKLNHEKLQLTLCRAMLWFEKLALEGKLYTNVFDPEVGLMQFALVKTMVDDIIF